VTDRLEQTAQRIAEQGRGSLVDYLRPAFQRTAAAHALVVQLDAEQLEWMVQSAADRADGLLWRRALAGVATEELGISLGEAAGHPAVARAQAIAGAPPYTARPRRDGAARRQARPRGDGAARRQARPRGDRAAGLPARPGRDGAAGAEGERSETTMPELSDLVPEAIRLRAVHLGGIEGLGGEPGTLELRFSAAGLDILSADSDAVLGRLGWAEIQGLDLPHHRGLHRRRRSPPQLVVRTSRGQASFEVPGLTEAELRSHLAPMFERAAG
jgi:hypothetical protein